MSDCTAASPRQDDGWDWPYLVYIGRVWLCYTEPEFWKLTPRQLVAQIRVHEEVTAQMHGAAPKNGQSMSRQPLGYIDQIPGW